jgi:hypothetical protein
LPGQTPPPPRPAPPVPPGGKSVDDLLRELKEQGL